CPAWADCSDPGLLEQFRRAVSVPGTARSIWARRASESAAVAPGRLGEISVPVAVVAVTLTPSQADALASRFERAESLVTTPGRLATAIAGGSGDDSDLAHRHPSLQSPLGRTRLRQPIGLAPP